jgi:dipeptidyl aminopeptidase/acylaminoacyl peptidase
VLDAARSARNLLGPRVSKRVAVLGHSEGGQAALFAAQEQPSYAPDIALKGVIASAPGANLLAALHEYAFSPFTQLNALRVIAAWHEIYGLPASDLLTKAGIRDALLLLADRPIPDASPPFSRPPDSSPELRRLAALNTPGAKRSPVPMLILVGTADTQVPPATNITLAKSLQREGDKVRLLVFPGADHNTTPLAGAQAIAAFLRRQLGQ